MPGGGQVWSIAAIGYMAFLMKDQNQATKNITSEMMNMIIP